MPHIDYAEYNQDTEKDKIKNGTNKFHLHGTGFTGSYKDKDIAITSDKGTVDKDSIKIDHQDTTDIKGGFKYERGKDTFDEDGTMSSSVPGSNTCPTSVKVPNPSGRGKGSED